MRTMWEHKLCEETVKDTVDNWYGDLDCDAFPPNAELYMKHTVLRVFYVLADEFGNFLACGRPESLSYEKRGQGPSLLAAKDAERTCAECLGQYLRTERKTRM